MGDFYAPKNVEEMSKIVQKKVYARNGPLVQNKIDRVLLIENSQFEWTNKNEKKILSFVEKKTQIKKFSPIFLAIFLWNP